MIEGLLDRIRVARFHVTYESASRCTLPPYLGSTLRGAVGMALKRSVCTMGMRGCGGCPVIRTCVYPVLFETPLLADSEAIKRMRDIPHPLVFEPPFEHPGVYQPGDRFTFSIVLFGDALERFPYVVHALIRAGEIGLGREREPFRLAEVLREDGGVIYRFPDSRIQTDRGIRRWRDLANGYRPGSPGTVALEFLTPTRLKEGGDLVRSLSVRGFIGTVLRRIAALSLFHGGASSPEIDFRDLLPLCERIRVTGEDLRWRDWNRYSNRQKGKVSMGGFMGKASLAGDLEPLVPFLRLGEYVHAGKGAVMGLGRYRLIP